MAIRLIMIILAFVLAVNLILVIARAVLNIDIYGKYGKLIFKWFAVFFAVVIAVYIVLSIFALN